MQIARPLWNVRGFMYTPWERKYELLPEFGKLLSEASVPSKQTADGQWPQFRGVHASGVGETDFPTHFGPDPNVVWKIAVPSGHSSPCIWGEQIFLTGFNGNKLQVLALNRRDGALLWRRELEPA